MSDRSNCRTLSEIQQRQIAIHFKDSRTEDEIIQINESKLTITEISQGVLKPERSQL